MSQKPPVGAETRIDQMISLDAREVRAGYLVTVTGEVDMLTTPHLRSYLQKHVQQAEARLVLDLRGVAFLGSSGLAVLVETLDWTRERDIALRLVCTSREVLRPLEATGLTELFDIRSTPEDALASS